MYMEHFGLSGQPFQLTPDARFWFDSRTHKKAMAYLGYGLAQGEGFITVTGEIGAGKSTLVAHLMANIDRARLNAISLVSTQVEGDDMLRLVAQGLGVDTRAVEKARLLDAIEQRLEEEVRAGKRTLLIVDEAQNLPVSALEELRMLSNFQIGGRALLQTVLLGQPEFRDKLAGPGLEQLRQRVIASHHLDAMGADEVDAYLRHRLTRVDWQGNPEFGSRRGRRDPPTVRRHSAPGQPARPPAAAAGRAGRRGDDRGGRRPGGRRRHGRRCGAGRSGARPRGKGAAAARRPALAGGRQRARAGAAAGLRCRRRSRRSSAASPRWRRAPRSRKRCCGAS